MLKKNMKGIMLSLVLVLAVSVILTGCGGSKQNAGGSGGTSGKKTQSAAQSGGASGSAAKPKLKLLKFSATGFDYQTYPVAKYLEQATGYKVSYDTLPQDHAQDKLNLIMSSGANYDLMNAGKQDYFRFAVNGALTDLTPLIDKYGPNIQKAISQKSLNAVKVNGKIYAIPDMNTSYIGGGILVRTDWLKKLNMKMPSNLQEFTAMLKAFKTKDPAGNGSSNIPFTISGSSPLADGLLGAYGLFNSWNSENGKMVARAQDPKLKDYLNFMHTLYQQGLLDKEFATNKSQTADQKFTSGRAGAVFVPWYKIPSYDAALKKNNPKAAYAYIPIIAGPGGEEGYGVGQGFDWYTFVPTTSKHAVDAIKYINALLAPDVFRTLYIGKENVDYNVKNGQYFPIQPAFFKDRGYASNYTMGRDEKHFMNYWQARLRKSQPMFTAFQEINGIPDKDKHPDVLGYSTYLPNMAKDTQKLTNIVNDFAVKAIVSGVNDQTWKSFQSQWSSSGGSAVAAEVNKWYSAQSNQ